MRDWILTVALAAVLTAAGVLTLGIERRVGPIAFTFGLCLLIAGVGVRLVVDGLARRRRSRR